MWLLPDRFVPVRGKNRHGESGVSVAIKKILELNDCMKLKILLIVPALFLLSACSASNQSAAEEHVVLGCEEFVSGYKTNNYIMPTEARSHFAQAARLDPGYIPLAQAAQNLSSSYDTMFVGIDFRPTWHAANALVWGVCAD